MAGRPTLLTSELAAEFCQHIANGNPICTSAKLVGIADSTARNWIARGREEQGQDTKYSAFLAAFEKAQAESESFHVGVIRRAATDGTWQASAWALERSPATRERWKRPTETKEIKVSTDINSSELQGIETQIKAIASDM